MLIINECLFPRVFATVVHDLLRAFGEMSINFYKHDCIIISINGGFPHSAFEFDNNTHIR